jgi:hypothetical protein
MAKFRRTLPIPSAKEYVGKRQLKQRIMRSLQALTKAFSHTRKKQAIFDFINCLSGIQEPDRLPFYSPDACPKRKEKAYLFFCFIGTLVQAWWKFDTDDEDGEESKEETQAVIEAALLRIEDVAERGLGAYKICGDLKGYWLEKKSEEEIRRDRFK